MVVLWSEKRSASLNLLVSKKSAKLGQIVNIREEEFQVHKAQ